LPELVAHLCASWELQVEGGPMHGGLGLVLPVRHAGGASVLKVSWPGKHVEEEAIALRAWDGRGAVRLERAEPAHGALVLERLDARRSLADQDLPEAVTVAGSLLRQLAIEAPPGLPSASAWAVALRRTLARRWEQQGQPFDRRLLERTLGIAAELAGTAGSRLINYDLHYADVLASDRAPWLVVDPKAVVGEPEFGLAQLLWRRLEAMEAQGGLAFHFQALVEAARLDAELARAWTLVRTVDYWLWGLGVGLTEDPERCRRVVAWLLPGR
jgi:streptomycin 6-kinase